MYIVAFVDGRVQVASMLCIQQGLWMGHQTDKQSTR
jgi:hypothetical protein